MAEDKDKEDSKIYFQEWVQHPVTKNYEPNIKKEQISKDTLVPSIIKRNVKTTFALISNTLIR